MKKFWWISLIAVLTGLFWGNTGFAATLIVQLGGIPPTFPSIEAAILAANPAGGDIIKVMPGTYTAPNFGGYKVNIPVQIVSQQGPDKTIIEPYATTEHGFTVSADNVTISGFTIHNHYGDVPAGGACGIIIGGTDFTVAPPVTPLDGVKVTNCVVEFFSFGIIIMNANGTQLTKNTVRKNTASGILIKTDNFAGPPGADYNILNTVISQNTICENYNLGLWLLDPSLSGASFDGTQVLSNTFYNNGSSDTSAPSNKNSKAMQIRGVTGTINIKSNKFLKLSDVVVDPIDVVAGSPVLVRSGNRAFNKLKGSVGGTSAGIDP
jgi:hypothetical protein